MKKEKLPGEHEEFEDNIVTYPEEEDVSGSSDIEEDEEEDDQENVLNMAPTSIPAYIKFMMDKKNRKDKLGEMPSSIRGRIVRGIILMVALIAVGIAMAYVYKTPGLVILPVVLAVGMFFITLKNYLDGSTRQYVTLRGTVVRSDYAKSALAAAKNAAQKTARADFFYRSFIMKKDDEYIKINCRKARELPQEGDKVRVIVHARTSVYEEEGITELTNYICIDRIA